MPRTVDKEAQRRIVGDALLGLVSERGLDAVSVRTVAAAAGKSVGAVQKYFSGKDDMLRFAAELVGERVEHRMDAVDPAGSTGEVLRELVLATLPVDPARRAEAAVSQAFAARAVHHEGLAAVQRETDQAVRTALAGWFEELREGGRLESGADCLHLADAVIALADGFTMRMLYSPGECGALVAALDTALARLVPVE
ncbi:TetR/AcrR family transcriptional regulator [Streptomyces sp. NPDC048172]|uniref:TetR/AcrR family transcriptional regulator n=1 Tax=Streptomyces sp. NPDC048172 TaxID=3365505 RepID=UPI00371E743B